MHFLFQLSNQQLMRDARRGSLLNSTAAGIDLFFQFLTLTVLARLLTPPDFGLFAMVTPFVWFIMNFGDLGLGSAILQQPDLTEGQASAVFRVNLLAGFVFAGLFLAASPLLGLLYHEPRVTPIAATLSLTFVILGLTAVQRALLRRALLFRALLGAQIAASIVSCVVAVTLAGMGAGYWALAVRALAEALTYSVAVWVSTRWIPGRPEWDTVTRSLLRYGRYYLGYSLLNSAARQGDNILIGWRFGSAELGPYALAYRLFFLPVQQFSWPLSFVMIPTLSRLRGEPDRLKRWYSELLRLMTLIAFPPLFSLIICADDLVYLVVGPQWAASAEILRVLAPVSALQVASATIDWLMQAHGRADRAFGWSLVSTATYLTCFVIGLPWGALGVAAGLAAANLLLFVPGFVYAGKGTSVGLADVFKAILPSFGIAALSVAAVYVLRVTIAQEWHPFVRLLATGTIIAATILLGMSILYHRYWRDYATAFAPLALRAARPIHEWRRWQIRRRRQQDVDRRMELLRRRLAQRPAVTREYRVSLEQLSPELNEICRPLRQVNREIALADVDEDGFLHPRFGLLWAAATVDRNRFLPRKRFEVTVVDHDGSVGICKQFHDDKGAFVNELEASLDLTAAGCHVPAVWAADFDRLAITFAYINGTVVREALAQAGAPIRDRDVPLISSWIGRYKLDYQRRAAGRKLVHSVLDPETIARIGDSLLAIHRAGYVLEDVKYGNVIIEATTKTPYFIDCERALPLHDLPPGIAHYLQDNDIEKLNQHFGTGLRAAKAVHSTVAVIDAASAAE